MNRILYTPRENKFFSRSSKKNIFLLLIAILILGFFSGGIYVFRMPYWQVQEIAVSGNKVLDSEGVEEFVFRELQGRYSFFIPKTNIFLIQRISLEQALKDQFPKIQEVWVTRNFPHTLNISLVERELWGIVCAEQCAYIDETGFAYESSPFSSGSLITKITTDAADIRVGNQVFESVFIEHLRFLGEKVEETTGDEAIGYELFSKNPNEIRAKTNGGYNIYFNREDDFQNVFRVLKRVLEEEIKEKKNRLEYIDLRFGNKVFFKLK